jgi:hypothetical protein
MPFRRGPENSGWLFIMPYTLVPVDYQPDFSDYSLVPVDYDPFEGDDAARQIQAQSAEPQPQRNQPVSAPQLPATGAGLPDVGAPLIGDGGQFSSGVPWTNKAADIASKFAGNTFRDAINLVATPGAIMQPNPYPPGSEEASWYDDQRQQLINNAAPALAFAMLGAGAPMAESGAAGALGGKLARGIGEESHHPQSKYLGGAVKQELVSLPKSLHYAFHRGLDATLPRWKGTAYYESLDPTERQQALQYLATYTKNFDAEHGTKLYDALLRNGFSAP